MHGLLSVLAGYLLSEKKKRTNISILPHTLGRGTCPSICHPHPICEHACQAFLTRQTCHHVLCPSMPLLKGRRRRRWEKAVTYHDMWPGYVIVAFIHSFILCLERGGEGKHALHACMLFMLAACMLLSMPCPVRILHPFRRSLPPASCLNHFLPLTCLGEEGGGGIPPCLP